MRRRILAACMALCMAATMVVTGLWGGDITAYAAGKPDTITVSAYDNTDSVENLSDSYKDMLDATIKYIRNTVTEAEVGSIGGEWAVLDLARYGYEDPEWYTAYYNNVVEYVRKKGSNKLHSRKLTENSRVIIGLTAIGADPTNVGGYNLLEPLADLEDVVWQGVNGTVYALIAFDVGKYEIPKLPDDSTATQTTREGLIRNILDNEITATGGWALSGAEPDPDITAMAVQALAPYYNTNPEVKAAVDRGMKAISDRQKTDGGLASWGTVNSESCAQAVCALADLGRDADTDPQYVKNKNSVLDAMLAFYIKGGGFAHAAEDGDISVNQMATEQAAYALVAYDRYKTGKKTLYDMSDRKKLYIENETTKKSIKKTSVTIDDLGLLYDGTEKRPVVTVKYGDILLTEGIDYTKEYSNNINVGNTAKVTITGMGDYTGAVAYNFEIKDGRTNITAFSFANGVVNLKWKVVDAAKTYAVYRKASSDVRYTKIGTTAGNTYKDGTVKAGTSYKYVVRPVIGKSLGSSPAVKVNALATPTVTMTNTAAGVTVSWKKISGAKQYRVYRKVGNAKSWTKIATVNATKAISYVDRQVKAGVKYIYTVRAAGDHTVSGYTAKVIYRVAGQSISGVSSPAKAKISAKVKKDSTVTGYQLQYSKSSAFKETKTAAFAGAAKTSLTVRTAGAGVKYYVRVRSYKKVGNTIYYGAWSKGVKAVTRR